MRVVVRTFSVFSLVALVALLGACDSNSGKFLWEKGEQQDAQAQPPSAPEDSSQQTSTPASPNTSLAVAGRSDPATGATANTTPATGAKTGEDVLVPFDAAINADATPSTCHIPGFTPPADFRIYVAGAYSGSELDYQIDQSGHQATRIDVAVNQTQAPVVLMLGAYEPTVWNIGWSKDTHIAAVLLSGYHRQVVAGLPKDVPVLISSYDNKGPCGYFYVGEQQLTRLNPLAQRLFGRKVDMVYPARDGKVLIGDALPAAGLITSKRVDPDSFRDRQAPLAGAAGLQDAVRQGLLREARSEDMQAWLVASAAVAAQDQPPVAGQLKPPRSEGRIHNGYVVLKPMQIPAGLYGANSATFFVPKGVPRPRGELGHSRLYDFNTLTCAGATCDMR